MSSNNSSGSDSPLSADYEEEWGLVVELGHGFERQGEFALPLCVTWDFDRIGEQTITLWLFGVCITFGRRKVWTKIKWSA